MAVTLIATVGDTSANTYCTLAEAESYMQTRLHKSAWTSASSNDKKTSLVWATRLLDEALTWAGTVDSSAQPLQWPRTGVYDRNGYVIGSGTIPQFVKNAEAELALHLISEDRTADFGFAGIKEVTVDVIKIKADKMTKKFMVPESVMTMVYFCAERRVREPRRLIRV